MRHVNIPAAFLMNDEKKILDAFPFFGGTSVEGGATTETGDKGDKGGSQSGGAPSGGDAGNNDNPLAALQSDPVKLQQLLDQVSKQSADLANITKERDTLTQEKDKAARAQLTKEENLQKDLENAQIQNEALHQVVTEMAKQNAFLTASGDIQWNSIKQAMAELDENNYTVEVDLENRTANVANMEQEVKRIAKDSPWLVKSAANPDEQNNGNGRGPGRPPGTGTPPKPPSQAQQGKQQRRDGMMNRFPVLMQRS